MGPPSTAPDYGKATNVKELLDQIGQEIYKKVHRDDADYRSALQGRLKEAKFPTRKGFVASHVSEPCDLIYEYDTNVTGGFDTNNPCANRLDVRFSDKYGGQCTDTKIHGNENNEFGACAPFRRLFLCDHHLSYMEAGKINNTHNLLLEVLLAAKYEGQSLVKKYNEYKERHIVFPSDICTILARSFADIGDIVRGKDLFIGYNEKDQEEKKQLQDSLKNIFKKIHSEVTSGKTNGTNVDKAKARYGSDKGNYYLLREDWWNANRQQVWKAITCDAPEKAEYFRQTCSGEFKTHKKCTCANGDVPTYFDYVPQYLRWFEEWAEDFCRLRKHKLQNAITNCRNPKGEDKYCDLNGYDCKGTASGRNKFAPDSDCHKCSVTCIPFGPWIDNQRKEFDKQKNKYAEEIKEDHGTTLQVGKTTINNLYVDDFYKELKTNYGNVEKFLEKLSEEQICKRQPEVGDEKKTSINFKDDQPDVIFSHTEYCRACPWCGTQRSRNGKWEAKDGKDCENEVTKEYKEEDTTTIPILSPDKEKTDMLEKYSKLCSSGKKYDKVTENWQCHYEKNEDDPKNYSDNCIQGDWKKVTQKDKIRPYVTFFNVWIHEMLEDSIKWREQFNNCINNENATKCIKWCKNPCECYKKWVERMKEEWRDIKKHFHKEKNLVEDYHFAILETYLEQEFLPSIEDAYGNDEAIDKIEELLEERRAHADSDLKDKEKKNIIDYLLEHEGKDAEKCTTTHNNNECPEEVNLHNNPCSEHINKPTASVKDIARKMKSNARKLLRNRGSKDELKGNISLAEFKNGGQGSELKGNICKIDNKYSNDIRGTTNGGACKGKDGNNERFKIGTEWKIGEKVETSYKDVFLPPRREHMCTSNLEHLETDQSPLKNSDGKVVNNSFLGDVLLAAKKEGDFIVEKLKSNGNQPGICRAIKYSFADIGDIIRGRDMWDLDEGSKKMEKNLVTIFGKIKDNLADDDIKNKYTDDDVNHTKLREDWWEANRYQVWNAMKCAMKNGNIDKCNGIPLDDYIPQRLRWMTEWAEWFCKEQYSLYDKLETQCGICK
ncbi:hypothetical protein PFTANZ_03159, partial [Plasmodium falciparum Tanzania (2000708)]